MQLRSNQLAIYLGINATVQAVEAVYCFVASLTTSSGNATPSLILFCVFNIKGGRKEKNSPFTGRLVDS